MSNLKEKIKAAQIDLIKELGIDKLEQEQKEKIITDIGEIIQQRIVMRVVEELPEDKQDEFQGLLEKAQENPEALDDFIKENIPGIEDMILEEIGEYKQGALEMLGKTQTEQSTEDNQEGISEKEKVAFENEEIAKEEVKPEVEEELIETEEPREDLEVKEELVEEKPENIEEKQDAGSKISLVPSSADFMESEDAKNETVDKTEGNPSYAEATEDKSENKSSFTKATEDREKADDNLSGIEQEQIQNEEAILEENKVDHKKTEGEELDLTEELDKMAENDNQEEDKK
jgi:hypothetical protein